MIFFKQDTVFGTKLDYLLSNGDTMAIEKKPEAPAEEKAWENPVASEKPADHRDEEQLERQINEAKRRHDNLEENTDAPSEDKQDKNN